MRAIQYHRYGGPEVLQLTDIPKPTPGPDEVLVRIVATSVNAADYRLMRADPFLVRLENGLLRPKKHTVLGSDFAGTVEAVGDRVTSVVPGDEVFGETFPKGLGAFAEYATAPATSVVRKPKSVSFETAAAATMGGITALQGLALASVGAETRLLVQGAGGGVGGFVVQAASSMGAHVTAVCSAASAELARANGADEVLDYARDDFAAGSQRYDAILGVNGHRSLRDYRGALRPNGRYIMIGGTGRQLFAALLLGGLSFAGSGKKCRILTLDDNRRSDDLQTIAQMLDDGRFKPTIAQTFALEETADAIRFVENGHVQGKVVIEVAS